MIFKSNLSKNTIFIKLLFLFSLSGLLFSQSINGFVREESSGEPISYANIFLENTSLGAATNRDGYFVISDIPLGSYTLNASMIGYGIFKKEITINDSGSIRLTIFLDQEVIETSEIIVTAERQKFERSIESSQISLDLREINSAPAFIEPDVFRTLQMLPGVQTSSDFSSALYVRGSTPDQNLIMLDGITVYNPYHLGGIFSTFNTDAIKEADFHAGGFPARYGGRMGAILNIINREGNVNQIKGMSNISLISSKLLLEGPMPSYKGMRGSWMVSGRRTYFDRVIDALKIPIGKKADGSNEYFQFPYYFYDYQIKANLDINEDHRLTYTRFYGDDILNWSFDEKENYNDTDVNVSREFKFGIDWPWGNKTNGLTWRWIVSPTIISKTFISNSYYRFNFNFSFDQEDIFTYSDSSATRVQNIDYSIFDKINDNTLETEIIWKANNMHEITGGFQLKNVGYDLGIDIEFETQDTLLNWVPLDLKNKTREVSLFIQDKLNYSEKVKMQIGLRATDYNLHDKIYFDPRIGLKYHYNSDIAFKINWGVYHQFLTTANNQDENLRLVELWLGIPEDKDASISQHLIGGAEYMSPQNIFYRLEVYKKTFDNLLTVKQENPNTFEESNSTETTLNEFWDTKGNSWGIELLLKKSSGKLNGWLGYTFSEANYYNEPSGWHHPNFDRTHTLNLILNYDLTDDIQTNFGLTMSSGNPYTKILGRVYDWQQNLDSETYWYPVDSYIIGEKNTERYDKYFRVDVGMTRKKGKIGRFNYDTYWQIMNVTKHLNVLSYAYRTKTDPFTGNRIGVERRAVPMFPLIITFGIKFDF